MIEFASRARCSASAAVGAILVSFCVVAGSLMRPAMAAELVPQGGAAVAADNAGKTYVCRACVCYAVRALASVRLPLSLVVLSTGAPVKQSGAVAPRPGRWYR